MSYSKQIKKAIRGVPGVEPVLRMLNLTDYEGWRYGKGLFESYEKAVESIPASRKSGYDHGDSAKMYLAVREAVRPSDYAMFYWLNKLLLTARNIFDLGGNLGRSYFPALRYLSLPDDLRWVICDVPAVVTAGRELASPTEARHLEFTTEFADSDGTEVLLTCGTLQYLPNDLTSMLIPLARRPRHVLINRVPFSDRATYFTVQDIGPTCCPYRISESRQFLGDLASLGYELVDTWSCPESWFTVKYRPALKVPSYTGHYLRLRDDTHQQDNGIS